MKKIPTTLPITIESEYEFNKGDLLESVRQQVEVGIFHLQTLFNLSKRAASDLERQFREDENNTVNDFCYDIQNISDLGFAITMSIWKAVSELTELQMKTDAPNEIEAVKKEVSQ